MTLPRSVFKILYTPCYGSEKSSSSYSDFSEKKIGIWDYLNVTVETVGG